MKTLEGIKMYNQLLEQVKESEEKNLIYKDYLCGLINLHYKEFDDKQMRKIENIILKHAYKRK